MSFGNGEVQTGSGYSFTLRGTKRLRAQFGLNFGWGNLFAALGGASSDLSNNYNSTSARGGTFGVGGEFAVSDRLGLRLEVLRDHLSGSLNTKDVTYNNTTVRAVAIFRF